ncbi:MAG: 2'-5' RNA ligase family protein [Nocardiopsaceae bacterium]|jgi:2'-5' RNA ligase|nr:2'-5' RNA ligase family protein [Nocardiopsaceae bacterium]
MTWLMPAAGPVRDHLLATIDRIAADHSAPRFQPHLTLAPTFDSAADVAAQALASQVAGIPPIDVAFNGIGHEQAYFRALYLLAGHSAQLTTLQEVVQRALAPGPWSFMPHLSLLYSDIPEAAKQAVIDSIGIPSPLTVRFDGVELWARDDPDVRAWYRVTRVALASHSQQQAR